MKYIKSLICILLVAVMFSGCSFKIASSVYDLISPVAPFGDNADIQSAMDTYVKNGYNLKTPTGGKYKSSYSFYDIDGDKQKEAFAFYEPKDNLGTVNMAILKRADSTWSVVSNVVGEGKDVYSIDFNDITGNNKKEIFVCWDSISNSTNHLLSVYGFSQSNKSYSAVQIGNTLNVNNYSVAALRSDGTNNLLIFQINTGNRTSSAKAELYSVAKNKFKLIGETKLDSRINTFSNILVENVGNQKKVYADGIGSDGKSMTTEVIYWSDIYDTIISPFYSYSTGITEETTRKLLVPSMDVNNDKEIEIPSVYKLKLPKQVAALNWMKYKNTTLVHSCYSLYAKNDNYTVVLDNDVFKKVTAEYNEKTNEMTVVNKNSGKKVFSVVPVLKAIYSSSNFSSYTVVMEKSGYYYLAKIGDDTDIKMNIDTIKSCIKYC